MSFVGPAEEARGVELIANGDFELNNGLNGDNSGFGWYNDSDPLVFDVYSHTTAVYYTGAPPAGAGEWYFHTVGIGDATGVYQDVDLTTAATATQIDAGTVAYDFTAFLSGWSASNDHPRLELTFQDAAGGQLGAPAVLDGGVSNAGGTLTFDTPDTFRSFVDGTLDPLVANPIAMWKEYGDVAGVPVGARTARVTIFEDTFTANGNDDYTDNVSLDVADTGVEQFLKIQVNKTTGAIQFRNDTPAARDINFYEITSDAGVLDSGWNSLANQQIDSQGAGPEDNWREGGGSDSNLLTEAFLHATTLDPGETITMASAYGGGISGAEDLIFQYGLTSGRLVRGIINYVSTPVDDPDGDGDYDGADLLALQRGFPGTFTGTDFDNWQSNYGSGFDAAQNGNLPEPAGAILIGMGLAAATLLRRRND